MSAFLFIAFPLEIFQFNQKRVPGYKMRSMSDRKFYHPGIWNIFSHAFNNPVFNVSENLGQKDYRGFPIGFWPWPENPPFLHREDGTLFQADTIVGCGFPVYQGMVHLNLLKTFLFLCSSSITSVESLSDGLINHPVGQPKTPV